jgi:hypothetical protein
MSTLFVEKENIIKEILETEKKYVKDLSIILSVYQKPIEQCGLVDEKTHKTIFKNLVIIIGINGNLLKQLETFFVEFQKQAGVWSGGNSVGKIFMKWAPFLKTYTEYCNSFETSAQVLRETRKANHRFDDYLRKLEVQHKATGGLALSHYLIMPVQRIPRYSLLLRELEKQMDQYDDQESMTKAIEEIRKVANFMNDKLKLFDSKKKMLQIQQRLEMKSRESDLMSEIKKVKRSSTLRAKDLIGFFKKSNNETSSGNLKVEKEVKDATPVHNIIEPYRNYVHEGHLCQILQGDFETQPTTDQLKKIEKAAFLFSDMIMFCEDGLIPESLIFLYEIKFEIIEFLPWVRDLTDTVFQVVLNKTYTFIAKSKEEKVEWVTKFTLALDKLVEVFPDHDKMTKCLASWTPKFVYDIRSDLFEIEDAERRKFEIDQREIAEKVKTLRMSQEEEHVDWPKKLEVPKNPHADEFSPSHFQHLNLEKLGQKRQEKKKLEVRILEEQLERRIAEEREEKMQIEREKEEKERKEREEKERLYNAYQERLEREKIERMERLLKEKEEQEIRERETQEKLRLEKEKQERERLEKQTQEDLEREAKLLEEQEMARILKEMEEKAEKERRELEEKQDRLEKERIIREMRNKSQKKEKNRKSIDPELQASLIFEEKKRRDDLIKIVEEKEMIKISDQPKDVIDRLVALYLDQSRDQSKRLDYCRIIDEIKKKKFKKK